MLKEYFKKMKRFNIITSLIILFQLLDLSESKCSNLIENPLLKQTKIVKAQGNANCICGLFVDSQIGFGKSVQSRETPIFTKEIDLSIYPCGFYGNKQCVRKCMDTILQYIPQIGPIVCSTLKRNINNEKLYLFTKSCGKTWEDTGYSTGNSFCCVQGEEVECLRENDSLSGLQDIFAPFLNAKNLPDLFMDIADQTASFANNFLRLVRDTNKHFM